MKDYLQSKSLRFALIVGFIFGVFRLLNIFILKMSFMSHLYYALLWFSVTALNAFLVHKGYTVIMEKFTA